MKRILLLQLDGKLPNIALMRLSAHEKMLGNHVEFRHTANFPSLERGIFDAFDRVYASAIFTRSAPLAHRLKQIYPCAIIGGTGWDETLTLEDIGVYSLKQDYSIYPKFRHSIGFSQRGCRLRCKFCVVPRKEGAVHLEQNLTDIWRGPGHSPTILLLDNDFFGAPNWELKISEIKFWRFKVCFSQGINARMLTDESAKAIASIDYRDDSFKVKRIYTAWDNLKDEERLFNGLKALVRHGVMPDHIMVYMLIGYWPDETWDEILYRHKKLRDFGVRPYPMPYERFPALVGFQRWVIGAYDKRISWKDWKQAGYRPENLKLDRNEETLWQGSTK